MKKLIFLILLITTINLASSQNYCTYFVPDYDYTGNNAPDLKIELTLENGETLFTITSTKKDEPFLLPKPAIQFFLKNGSKLTIGVSDCTLKYIVDSKDRSIPTYIYKPSTVESIQLKSGILGIIYIEQFPGDIIGYTPIGGC